MKKTVKILNKDKVRISFPYDKELVAGVKSISGAKYEPVEKCWDISLTVGNLFRFTDFTFNNGFSLCDETVSLVEKLVESLEQLETPLENFEVTIPDTIKADLRPYQVEGVKFMCKFKQSMNACDMGLGKSLQTIVALECQNSYPALIVVPASLKNNWFNEYKKFCPSKSVQILDSKDEIYSGKDVYIINYDILDKKKDRISKLNFKAIVFDESQKLKSSQSLRTRAAKKISKGIGVRYLLTGTAINNRPAELISQFQILGVLDMFGGYDSFVNRYCDPKLTPWGKDVTGASNLDELFQLMTKWFYFRREKKQVLTELPDKQFVDCIIDIDNRKEYNTAKNELVSYLQNQVLSNDQIKEAMSGLDKEEAIEAKKNILAEVEEKVGSAEQLVLLNTLRKVCARGKLKAAQEWIEDFLESGQKLLVFANHTEIIHELSNRFECKYIDGSIPPAKRQLIVDNFQNNDKVKLLILNTQAGGVGLTLTASSNVLFLEDPWTPTEKDQACDRVHRIGQKNAVTVYTLLAKDTIDFDINLLLNEKRLVVDAVNKGISVEGSGKSVMGQLLLKFSQ